MLSLFFIAFQSCAQILFKYLQLVIHVITFSKLLSQRIFPSFISFGQCNSFASANVLMSASHGKGCSNPVNIGLCLTAGLFPVALIINPWIVSPKPQHFFPCFTFKYLSSALLYSCEKRWCKKSWAATDTSTVQCIYPLVPPKVSPRLIRISYYLWVTLN